MEPILDQFKLNLTDFILYDMDRSLAFNLCTENTKRSLDHSTISVELEFELSTEGETNKSLISLDEHEHLFSKERITQKKNKKEALQHENLKLQKRVNSHLEYERELQRANQLLRQANKAHEKQMQTKVEFKTF